jgi:ribosomal protein S2
VSVDLESTLCLLVDAEDRAEREQHAQAVQSEVERLRKEREQLRCALDGVVSMEGRLPRTVRTAANVYAAAADALEATK